WDEEPAERVTEPAPRCFLHPLRGFLVPPHRRRCPRVSLTRCAGSLHPGLYSAAPSGGYPGANYQKLFAHPRWGGGCQGEAAERGQGRAAARGVPGPQGAEGQGGSLLLQLVCESVILECAPAEPPGRSRVPKLCSESVCAARSNGATLQLLLQG